VKKTLQTLYRGNQGQQELARCEIIPWGTDGHLLGCMNDVEENWHVISYEINNTSFCSYEGSITSTGR
jgi:hypothetical protein